MTSASSTTAATWVAIDIAKLAHQVLVETSNGRRRAMPRALPTKRQPLLGVEAIAALLSELPAFALQQHEQSTIAEPHAGLRQLAQALPQRGQRVTTALVADAGETELSRPHGPPLAHLISAHQVVHDLALPDGL